MASITQRSGSYRVRIFRKNDKPISKSFSSEPEATQWLKKTQAQLELGLYQEEVKNQVNLKVGFSEAVEKYIPAHSVHKGNHKTEAGILRILASRWEGQSLSTISKQDIVLLKDDLLAKGRAASTVNHYLNALSQLYQIAIISSTKPTITGYHNNQHFFYWTLNSQIHRYFTITIAHNIA